MSGSAPFLTRDLRNESNIVERLLDRNVRENPRSIALKIISKYDYRVAKTVTYSELSNSACAIGNSLIQLGVEPSDRIALLLNDDLPFVVSFLAALKIGAVPILLSTFFNEEQLLHLLNDSTAKVSISEDEHVSRILTIAPKLSKSNKIVSRSGVEGTISLESMERLNSSHLETRNVSGKDMAFWFYTSGSTGMPKAVVHLHQDISRWSQPFYDQVLKARRDDIFYSGPKLFFSGGLSFGLHAPLLKGATSILFPGKQSATSAIEIIKNARPTLYYTVPTVYSRILGELKGTNTDFSSVRMFLTGGEPLSKIIFDQWRKNIGSEIVEAYGAAEFGRCISNIPGSARPRTCGKLLEGFEAKIVDASGNNLGPNQIGTLFIKGEGNFAEYWHMPSATKNSIHGEWINTGDLFYKDDDGYYHFSGRNDFAFKINGLWASPMEIEEAVVSSGIARECCVVPVEDRQGVTSLTAFIVLGRDASLVGPDASAIAGNLAKHLSSYKIPKNFVVLDHLPRNSIGKLDRGKMMIMANDREQQQQSQNSNTRFENNSS